MIFGKNILHIPLQHFPLFYKIFDILDNKYIYLIHKIIN